MTSSGEAKDVSLYLLGGLATAPQFMESFRGALHGIMERDGYHVRTSQLLFPYGDWSRNVIRQVWEIGRDMRLDVKRFGRSIGGKRAVEAIAAGREAGRTMGRRILIGHSGGGVAAVHAARQLLETEGGPPSPVIMIGSPRCRIPETLRQSVLYIYAISPDAGPSAAAAVTVDSICRLGTFGGWGRAEAGSGRRTGRMGWQQNKHAPAAGCGVPIIGKHADYFREHEPYINGLGLTNQWLTLRALLPWLRERLEEDE
ncbi:hypothetical protein [Paenibacillus sp. R14(2021)]|uniref:hypothetical protein n=1 Tax=Paenibacillus sp. R14(2021) TaxID=2859228 RepID=UPI001C614795|nr:hypothetical protein [Paenibacillus sp. R14(2021)]